MKNEMKFYLIYHFFLIFIFLNLPLILQFTLLILIYFILKSELGLKILQINWKKNLKTPQRQSLEKNNFYSPVSGTVKFVKKDEPFSGVNESLFNVVGIEVGVFESIFAPIKFTVKNLDRAKGKKILRVLPFELIKNFLPDKSNGVFFRCESSGVLWSFGLYSDSFLMAPNFSLSLEDCVSEDIYLGKFPLGGLLILYFPNSIEILVKPDDIIYAKMTKLCIFSEEK